MRSSILDNSFQGISRLPQMPESVTYVLGKSVTYVPGRTLISTGGLAQSSEREETCDHEKLLMV
jgi:hypothetical protein